MAGWALSQEDFDRLLQRLDPDRARAADKYEELRRKLEKFFEWRNVLHPDQLADETMDRLARKLAEGKAEENLSSYAYGIARMVLLEYNRRKDRGALSVEELAVPPAAPEPAVDTRMDCFTGCLAELPQDQQKLIMAYYQEDKIAKIALRERLAEELGINLNNLRIRAFRIRAILEACINGCVERGSH